jgi:hypothetical protein
VGGLEDEKGFMFREKEGLEGYFGLIYWVMLE